MKETLIFLCMLLVVMTTPLLLAVAISKMSCAPSWEGSGFETDWTFWGGCRIKVDGKWTPEDNYRELKDDL